MIRPKYLCLVKIIEAKIIVEQDKYKQKWDEYSLQARRTGSV
jgi:hypothetical protein